MCILPAGVAQQYAANVRMKGSTGLLSSSTSSYTFSDGSLQIDCWDVARLRMSKDWSPKGLRVSRFEECGTLVTDCSVWDILGMND